MCMLLNIYQHEIIFCPHLWRVCEERFFISCYLLPMERKKPLFTHEMRQSLSIMYRPENSIFVYNLILCSFTSLRLFINWKEETTGTAKIATKKFFLPREAVTFLSRDLLLFFTRFAVCTIVIIKKTFLCTKPKKGKNRLSSIFCNAKERRTKAGGRGNLCPRFAEASPPPLTLLPPLVGYKSSFNSPPFFFLPPPSSPVWNYLLAKFSASLCVRKVWPPTCNSGISRHTCWSVSRAHSFMEWWTDVTGTEMQYNIHFNLQGKEIVSFSNACMQGFLCCKPLHLTLPFCDCRDDGKTAGCKAWMFRIKLGIRTQE